MTSEPPLDHSEPRGGGLLSIRNYIIPILIGLVMVFYAWLTMPPLETIYPAGATLKPSDTSVIKLAIFVTVVVPAGIFILIWLAKIKIFGGKNESH